MKIFNASNFSSGFICLLFLNLKVWAVKYQQISPRSPFSFLEKRDGDSQPKCPPCFNCLLPAYKCHNSGKCNSFDGRCECPSGFGGDDCTTPLCGALSDGKKRKIRPPDSKTCECKDGWTGINCNLCTTDNACNPLMQGGLNGTCYKGGVVVQDSQQMCNVTNANLVALLPGKIPQVTFNCNRTADTCGFQFWAGGDESFSCTLTDCNFASLDKAPSPGENVKQSCNKIKCSCIPGRFLCEKGGIDISENLDSIVGPGTFDCDPNKQCTFSEPNLDALILGIFGDNSIELDCQAGECLYYTMVPGFKHPPRSDGSLFTRIAVFGVVGFFVILGLSLIFLKFKKDDTGYMPVEWEDESGKLMSHHQPATLSFKDICYRVGETDILKNIHGLVKPGELMAIMGASGAGKTSFLDILARRNKTGYVSGDICINGKVVSNREFKKVVGYVDQEDTLMPTLTVYETVLNSALLRLPRDMSPQAKKMRVLECLSELGIFGIKDSPIGAAGNRGISGGEKRRVSIACELVTSPAVLFLDEPTSGLDSFNAQAVIDCLVSLAHNYKRTIIFTIHQPRSNIFSRFDRLVLLSEGWLVYSGDAALVGSHVSNIGHPCPPGYNIADYFIDLTQEPRNGFNNSRQNQELNSESGSSEPLLSPGLENPWEGATHLRPIASRITHGSPSYSREHSQSTSPSFSANHIESGIRNSLAELVLGFKKSQLARAMLEEINQLHNLNDNDDAESTTLAHYQKPSWFTQFRILSSRAFINLYRDPILMLANYALAFSMALLCGTLYYQVSEDIKGFQNRMGLFTFISTLFGFSCLTSLQVFQPERILFMRERANGYYNPTIYFLSKLLFDLIPLRVIPPLLMGIVVYPMVGLVAGLSHFLLFLSTLILFNLTAASLCLMLGILIADLSLANLIASVSMLFSLLFSGPFLHAASLPWYTSWLKDISFFHHGLEAMLVNEMRQLKLRDNKYGLVIEIPAATILSTFGFDASAYWRDMIKLGIMFLTFNVIALLGLHFLVKERR